MSLVSNYYNRPLGIYKMSRARKERVFNLCKKIKAKKVLDLGCGVGEFGQSLKKEGVYVVGCDISAIAVEEAKKVLDEALVFDMEEGEWLWEKDYFDAVVMSEVIEHLFDPIGAIDKIKKILKPGGALIVTTPNFLVFSNRIKMLFGQFAYTESGFLDYGHLHFFTRRSMLALLREKGFETAEENNIYHPKIPLWLAKIFPNLFTYQVVVMAIKG